MDTTMHTIISAVPLPLALNDPQQNITFLNPEFIRTFGYTLEEIPTLTDWWPKAYPDPEYRKWVADTWAEELERSKRTRTAFAPMELNVTCKDGSVKTILGSAKTLDEEYKGEHLVVLYDISARKQAEVALKNATATQNAILNALPAHIALIDSQGVILVVNESWRRFASANTVRSNEFFVGHNYLRICEDAVGECSEDARRVAIGLRDVLAGKVPSFTIEYPCHSPTEKHWFRLMATPMSEDLSMGVVVMHVNVTDRKLAMEELQESEAKFSSAFDHAAIGIGLLSPEGRWLKVNPELCVFLGYSAAELLTRTFRDVTHPDDLEVSEIQVSRLLAGEIKTFRLEKRYLNRAGNVLWGLVSVTLVRPSSGKADFFLAEIVDITARKQTEAELLLEKEFSQSVLNGLSYLICVVDLSGTIVAVNQAWRVFAIKSGTLLERVSVGRNYLAICDTALGRDSAAASLFAEGIREVLSGRRDSYMQEYVAHGLKGSRRLIGKVTKFSGQDKHYAIIAHEDVTEWRKTEAELRTVEKRLALALESANDGIWDWDIAADSVQRNDRCYTMLGYDPSEVNPGYSGWKSLLHPEDSARVEAAVRESLEGRKENYESEFRMKCKDGSWCWVLSRGRVVQRDKNGKPLRMVGTQTDINFRKQIEEALRESERFLTESLTLNRAIMDNFPGLISAKDIRGNFLLVNRHFENLEGPSPTECIGKNVFELFPKDVAEALRKDDLAAQKSEHPIKYEEVITHRDGALHTYLTTKVPLFKNNQVFATCAISKDITERRRAESIVQQSETRLRSVLNTITEGVVLVDSEGIIHLFNAAAQRIFGYEEHEILGQRVEVLMPSPHKEKHANYMRRFIVTGEPQIMGKGRELIATRKHGSEFPIYLNIGEVKLSGETYFTGVVRDLTKEKHEEEKRLMLEKQFAQSQKMEALGVLAGGIAHDFNNILASIMGYTELAKGKSADERVVSALNQVIAASTRARDLIKQVLMFSRTDSAQLKPIDLRQCVQELLQQIIPTISTKINIESDITTGPCWVMGDASQLHQLLLNLTTNALQAMPDGGILQVELSVQRIEVLDPVLQLVAGSYARVSVKDTGIGISQEIQGRIFEPFFSTKGIKGTGLGLSVVHGIVKKHEGAITVNSKVGQGSTFIVWLPLAKSARPISDQISISEFHGSGRVLIIDDDEMILAMSSEVFRDLGFEVDTFIDPAGALSALTGKAAGYCLLVSDYTMPTMNGLETIERAHRIVPTLPAILMTGYGDTLVYEKDRSDFKLLTKPFKVSELTLALREVLKR